MGGLWALAAALLMEPTAGDWRVIHDDPGNAVLAVETSGIAGPSTRRVVVTAAATRQTLDGNRYLLSRIAIDCDQRQTTLLSADLKTLGGDPAGSLDLDDLESTTAPASDGSPSAVALVCEGVPLNTRSFATDVAFIAWAAEQAPAP